MSFTYPAGDYDRPATLLSILGSFWSQTYAGRAQVGAYAEGAGRGMNQAHADLLEAQECLAFATVPPLHTEEFRRLDLRSDQRLPMPAAAIVGDPATLPYGGGGIYGQPPAAGFAFPLPPEYRQVPVIMNRIRDSSRTLLSGLDYRIEPGRITFLADPFAAEDWASLPVFGPDGSLVATEIALWLFRPGIDRNFLNEHLAYVLGLDVEPELAIRDALADVLLAYAGGTARDDLDAILSAITGIPLAVGGDTVTTIGTDGDGFWVQSDRATYRFGVAAQPLVAPGDGLAAGQPLTDALRIDELNTGVLPAGVHALSLGRGFLAGTYLGELTFEDRDVPLEVDQDVLGNPRLSFELGGFPADVDHFFDIVHARGLAAGTTFADLLGTPLPATINPLRFLVANLLRGGAFLIRIRMGAAAPGGAGLEFLRLLRRVIPPQTVALFLVEMAPAADSVTMDSPGEVLDNYLAPEPVVEGVVPSAAWDGPGRPRIVSRTCH